MLPSLAVWIEELPRPTDTWPTTAYGWLCLCLIGSIVLGGWLDKYDANTAFTMVGIVAFVVAFVISFVMAVVVVFVVSNVVFSVNTVFNVMLGAWSIAVVNVALGVAFGVAFGVAVVGGVVGSNIIKVYRAMLMWATGMAAITTGGVSGYLAGNVWIGVSLGVVGIITVIVAVIIAFSVVYIMNDSLKKGEASKLSYSCFVALMLAYSFLIWYCYFGGYQRFV